MSPTLIDDDCTRVAPQRRTNANFALPLAHPPPTRRRIRPVPPGPPIAFVPLPGEPSPDRTDEQPGGGLTDVDLPWPGDSGRTDAWDDRADRLQWWMADLGGPHPVTIDTTEAPELVARTLAATLGRLGVDVVEANPSAIKGLLPAPRLSAAVRLAHWVTRRPPPRLETVEVRLEPEAALCRVSARASGERAAEALRVVLSDLPPAPRPAR